MYMGPWPGGFLLKGSITVNKPITIYYLFTGTPAHLTSIGVATLSCFPATTVFMIIFHGPAMIRSMVALYPSPLGEALTV